MKQTSIFNYTAALLLSGVLAVSCHQEKDDIDDYYLNYQIPEVPVDADISVGAYYYNLGSNFDANRFLRLIAPTDMETGKIGPNYKPSLCALGDPNKMYSMSAAPGNNYVFQQHLDWANEAGIDFLVMPVFREAANLYPRNINSADTTFVNYLTSRGTYAGNGLNWGNLQFCLSVTCNELSNGLSNNALIEDVASTVIQGISMSREDRLYDFFKRASDYFGDAKYHRINGRPVVVIILGERLYAADSERLYRNIRQAVKEHSGEDVYLIARQPQWTPSARYHYFYMTGKVDAIAMDNMCNVGNYDRQFWLPQLVNENFKYNREYIAQNYGIDFIPSVSPSYSTYVYNGTAAAPLIPKTTENFSKLCNVAKMNLGQVHTVLIESFNNWAYDSAIEPADEAFSPSGYGNAFLQTVRHQFKRQ